MARRKGATDTGDDDLSRATLRRLYDDVAADDPGALATSPDEARSFTPWQRRSPTDYAAPSGARRLRR